MILNLVDFNNIDKIPLISLIVYRPDSKVVSIVYVSLFINFK